MTDKTILVIEDDEVLREALIAICNLEGFETLSAKDGIEGVQLAFEHLPDLILTDINMPRLDGFGVLRQIRENPKTVDIPVIFVTASTDMTLTQKQQDLRANDVIRKPFDLADLLTIVKKHLA